MSENPELIEAIYNRLWRLDGTTISAVALVSGFSVTQLRELGGLADDE